MEETAKHGGRFAVCSTEKKKKKGLKFYQTRSNAIILHDTLPVYCIPKAIMMETGEIINEKEYASPRPPPKISFKDNWMKEMDSEVAGGSGNSEQIEPKSKTQLSRTVRLVSVTQEIEKDVLFGREGTNSRMERLVDGPKFIQSCVPVSVERVDDKDAHENVDADQIRTRRPVESEQIHRFVVVKQAENFRVRAREEDRESSSSRRLAARCLQPI